MNKAVYPSHHQKLDQLMDRAGCKSLNAMSQLSGLSSWQLQRIRYGLIANLAVADLVKLANALAMPVAELLDHFGVATIPVVDRSPELLALQQEYQALQQKLDRSPELLALQQEYQALQQKLDRAPELLALQQEYQALQQKLDRQKDQLEEEFQRASLATIESWLIQWPTAEAVARKNPQLSAVKILALIKPFQQLLQRWGVEPIHAVGEQVPYDPRIHHLIDGVVDPETLVLVRYIGYRHGEKLLHRAKVSLIAVEIPEVPLPEPLPVTSYF